jgi:hypothetical protein
MRCIMPKNKSDRRKYRTFNEWINDDRNLYALLRCAEHVGVLESFRDDDGQVRYRRTGKEVSDEAIEEAAEQFSGDDGGLVS